MSKIVFLNMAEDRTLELKTDGDRTWMDVADDFVYFLQGCGYQVTREDVADYFNEGRNFPEGTVEFDTGGHNDVFGYDCNDQGEISINLGDMVSTYTVDKKW